MATSIFTQNNNNAGRKELAAQGNAKQRHVHAVSAGDFINSFQVSHI